jgi:hypothetical protein
MINAYPLWRRYAQGLSTGIKKLVARSGIGVSESTATVAQF